MQIAPVASDLAWSPADATLAWVAPGHLGLRSMRERVERLGGTLQIESAAGEGTRVQAAIRLVDASAAET